MAMKFLLSQINKAGSKIMRFFIVTLLLWLCAKALPDYIESPLISDKLIESIYYSGRKVNKISYDALKMQNFTNEKNEEVKNTSNNIKTNNVVTLHSIEAPPPSREDDDFYLIQNYYSNYFNQLNPDAENEDAIFVKEEKNLKPKPEDANQSQPIDEKGLFSRNLYTLYGNRTIFKMDLKDLESVVTNAILTDGQAVIFWETLLQMKTDRAKIIYGKHINEVDSEFYLFNILALKTTGVLIITVLLFLVTHKLQAYLIKTYFFYNLISTCLTFYILDCLYHWKFYTSSSVMLLQLAFCVKYLYDSFICNFGFNKEDYDIFTNINKTKTITQFTLKFIVSFYSVLVIGYLAFFKYPYFFNYILFYVCCIQLVYHFYYFLQYEVAAIFQPFKHFTLITSGLLNFILTNFHKKMARFSNEKSVNDSFYIVSETFSFICISYFFEYLFTQAINLAQFFYEKENDTEEFNRKIATANNDFQEHSKSFNIKEDALWLFVFVLIFLSSVVGIAQGKYLIFIFSLQYLKMALKVFNSIFKIKEMRLILTFHIFFILIGNHVLSLKTDERIYDTFGMNNTMNLFAKFVVRLCGLIFLILIIISNFDYVVVKDGSNYNDDANYEHVLKKLEVSATYEKKKKKKIKTIEISIVKEDRTPFSFYNLCYAMNDFGMNYMSICCLFFLIKDVEKNYVIVFFYSIVLFVLLLRTFFIVHEIKNKPEFLISFFFLFLTGIRLILLTRTNSFLYFVGCIYLFFLILFYSMTYRRHFMVTLVMLTILYYTCCSLVSNYLMILMISLVCLPISSHFDDNKSGCSLLKFFLPGTIILFLQLYGFKNIFGNMLILNSKFSSFVNDVDLLDFSQISAQLNLKNEFEIIDWIFGICLKVFNEKTIHGGSGSFFSVLGGWENFI